MNRLRYILPFVTLSLIFSASAQAITLPSAPPALASYSPIAPAWKVSSAYGPRNVSSGTIFHDGIDLNQQERDLDKGVMLKAREEGNIQEIYKGSGARYITIKGASGELKYMHIFDDGGLPREVANDNVLAAGYSKVRLAIANYDNGSTKTCGAVRFYTLVNGTHQIQKLLTATPCSNATWTEGGKTVSAQTSVKAEEDIAPLGTSGGYPAHLDLRLNQGLDSVNVLAPTGGYNKGLIRDATERFSVALYKTEFTPDILAAMTDGPGFALRVTENSLVPILDTVKIQVPVDGGTWKTTNFSFGGRIDEGKSNTWNKNIPLDWA